MSGFVHLHVASSFSLRYGASPPDQLVARAAELGQHALALTDRDGLYGAVRFAQAAQAHSISPILGVDLAIESDAMTDWSSSRAEPERNNPGARRRSPARGGQLVDPRLPRVTILAKGAGAGVTAGAGWGRLCRLVTATHLRGERGAPVSTPSLIADHARVPGTRVGGDQGLSALLVLLGPESDVGRAALRGHRDRAQAYLAAWMSLLPLGSVAVELTCHGGPAETPGSVAHCRRLLHLATETGVPTVITAAVRHATVGEAATVDVLDAARRLVPLDVRHLDRVSTSGHLATAAAMHSLALRITEDSMRARLLIDSTTEVAQTLVQDPRFDLGIGAVHLPESSVLGLRIGERPQEVLAARCRAAVLTRYPEADAAHLERIRLRLDDELAVIETLGYAAYFLTVAEVVDLIRAKRWRVAARGSGAGSLVNYLLHISGIDPLEHDLLMERFCTPLRAQLPDIDIDVESDKRTQIYTEILDRFGGERVTCVSMMDTYRVRHAIRDVGAALGMPLSEIDTIAKAFPHIRARDARAAIAELPELRASGLHTPRLNLLFDLVERLDGLPRHVALHPCGVILSNTGLLDRTPVEASWLGFPMSQFDKDDVETLGLLKLDVLGIRMQSAMAHAVSEIKRVEGVDLDIDDRAAVPLDDPATFDLIASTRTLGCFQIESPGQRELVGKFSPETFGDIIIDISLFRPGPVKSDMITPFLRARQGWDAPNLLHPSLTSALAETCGVVVFHEQILRIIATTTGISLAEADEVRRALGSRDGQATVATWWRPKALERGYSRTEAEEIWAVIKAFASFGFCKAHAAAFALPTYQSAWLKTHYVAHFLAGVLTHDPGMYPKRLILDDARNFGVTILGLDVNASSDVYRVEALDGSTGRGIRLSLGDVKGISEAEIAAVLAAQPFAGLDDFWQRANVSRPVVEAMVLAGGFDSLYGMAAAAGNLGRHGRVTRRDLLLHVGELERWSRSAMPGRRRAASDRRGRGAGGRGEAPWAEKRLDAEQSRAGERAHLETTGDQWVRRATAAQSQAARPVDRAKVAAQLMLDLDDAPVLTPSSGLPEMSGVERVHAELDILGLDVTAHVVAPYQPMLDALGAVRSSDLREVRSRSEVLVAGVKVATQTPPVRSGRRVVFLTLDDSTGPIDATFFEDVQGPYASTVFHDWLLLVRGVVRRTGRQGLSLRATGAWGLAQLWESWSLGGADAVWATLAEVDADAHERAAALANEDHGLRVERPAAIRPWEAGGAAGSGSPRGDSPGGMGGSTRRVLVHPSGFQQSPYADVRPAGEATTDGRKLADLSDPSAPRKLWHSSPGSSGR